MNKVLNFFCFPIVISGSILLSYGLLGYKLNNSPDLETNFQTSIQINSLYSEKEITLKDPPVAEVLSDKFYVKIRKKPINPNIALKIKRMVISVETNHISCAPINKEFNNATNLFFSSPW